MNWSASPSSSSPVFIEIRWRQVAAADALRASAQHLDRHHHAAGQEQAGHERQSKPCKHYGAGTCDRIVERRIGFLDRQFDEYEPAQRRDRSIGGEHLAAIDVLRLLHHLGAPPRAPPHLSKLRHVGVAENKADVRMCDQATVGIDHIGLSMLADLDLRDDIPHELETDLGDADAGVEPSAGERQGHVGLGFPSEVDWAVIDLLCHRLREFGVV